MKTEEEKQLADILRENLDTEDLSGTYDSEKYEHYVSHNSSRKNRRWRELNLKIKYGITALVLCVAVGCLVFCIRMQQPNAATESVPNGQASSKTVISVTADPVQTTDTVTPTPSITPAATPKPAAVLVNWNTILVNPWNPVPEDFTVELETVEKNHSVDARIASSLNRMLSDARAEGLSPIICSSYRTNEKQQELYTNKVKEYLSQGYSQEDAESEAGKWVAVPGTSEHQTGLAVDIVSSSYQILDQKQEETAEQKWLMENCYKYGFILRYPNEKRDITGIYYEPWHYRYVGYKIAKEIHDLGICYEEYLEMYAE